MMRGPFSDTSNASAIFDEAPEGSEAPREALKANNVPARTMKAFLPYRNIKSTFFFVYL